jgi:hypothetical protein
MAADGHEYENTKCMGEKYISEDIWTSRRARSVENEN